MYRSYLQTLAIFVLLPCGYLAVSTLFLFRAGEYASLRTIVERQKSDPAFCIYGSALHGDSFFYKMEGEKAQKPDIISLGSSRVLQFRSKFFRDSFYNMGLAIDSINGGEQLFQLMEATDRPKIILLGVEYWWFNEGFASTTYKSRLPTPSPRMKFSNLIEPARFLWQGKVTLSQLMNILFSSSDAQCFLGLKAIQSHSGFGPDGSYYYTDLITGKAPHAEISLADSRSSIEQGTGRFIYGASVHPKHWEEFVHWLESMRAQGIAIIPFLPPIAPSVYQEMQKHHDQYSYIDDLLKQAKAAGISLADFRDARAFGSSDCEFIDGLHGGDITYARLLLSLAKKNPLLQSALDERETQEFIRANAGKTMGPDARITKDPEVDFLKLGCQK
jgi:hypothetical protein